MQRIYRDMGMALVKSIRRVTSAKEFFCTALLLIDRICGSGCMAAFLRTLPLPRGKFIDLAKLVGEEFERMFSHLAEGQKQRWDFSLFLEVDEEFIKWIKEEWMDIMMAEKKSLTKRLLRQREAKELYNLLVDRVISAD